MRRAIATLAAAALVSAAPAALAQHRAPPSGRTVDIQGADAWRRDPHMRRFYDVVVAAFGKGPDKVDQRALEKASFTIFRDFATSHGQDPDAMQDHLKLIPGQMISIAREDPQVLKTFEAFLDAMFGPK